MDINEMFDKFYSAYPKKKDKAKALRAFKKLNPDEERVNTRLRARERQKNAADWGQRTRQVRPYPSTYLNNRRWEDESDAENSGYDAQDKAFGTYL